MSLNKILLGAFVGIWVLSSCGGDSKKESNEEDAPQKLEVTNVGELTIAYYDMEKISTDFDFYVKTQQDLEKKKKALDDKLLAQQKSYENAAVALQKGMNSNTLTPNQMQAYQDKMRRAEEATFNIQQSEGVALETESFQANEVLMNKIRDYAQQFSEKNGIKLFVSKGPGSSVTYIDPAFDKTDAFIQFMNKKEQAIEDEISE